MKGQSLNLSPNIRKSNKRKAVTEVKTIKENNNKQDRQCTKKLNFIGLDEPKILGDGKNDLLTLDGSLNDSNNLSDSSTFARFKLKTLPKRKSAPGALAKKKIGRLKTLNDYFATQNRDGKEKRSKSPDENVKPNEHYINLEEISKKTELLGRCESNKYGNFITETENKKRKLFDPSETHSLKGLPTINVDVSFPYTASPPKSICKRVKTRAYKYRESESESCDNNPQLKSFEMENSDISAPRNSLSLFVRTPGKVSANKCKQTPTIVFTSIPRKECTELSVVVRKLGSFEIDDHVSERTSHIVTNSLRRTLKLLRGLARGCWIVKADWITKSELASKWLAEEHFELRSLSPAVTECRLQRQAFKKAFRMDLFSSCGTLFVAPNTNPPTQDLIDLIKLCRGKVASCARGAKFIIGDKALNDRAIVRVREKWILDSIFHYKLLDVNDYIVNSPISDKQQNNSSVV